MDDYVDVLPMYAHVLIACTVTYTHAHTHARIHTHIKYMWSCENTFSSWRYLTSFLKYDCLHCVRLAPFFLSLTWTLVTIHNSQCSKLLPRIAEMTTQWTCVIPGVDASASLSLRYLGRCHVMHSLVNRRRRQRKRNYSPAVGALQQSVHLLWGCTHGGLQLSLS